MITAQNKGHVNNRKSATAGGSANKYQTNDLEAQDYSRIASIDK
jgi:hypothetical protein